MAKYIAVEHSINPLSSNEQHFLQYRALKKIRRSISVAFADIYEVLVTEFIDRGKAGVVLHIGSGIVAITVNQY